MIKRNLYLKQIRPFYNTPMVKVLTGIRRSGKSTMLFLVQEDLKSSGVNENQFFRLNMEAVEGMALKDSDDLLGMLTSFFSSLVEGEKGYVFLDEVQLLSGWERVVNACNTSYNADIYITGSNASLLSSDLATYLSGRYIEFQIYPFSFSEFTELFSGLQKAPLELFIDYLTFGACHLYNTSDFNMNLQCNYSGISTTLSS